MIEIISSPSFVIFSLCCIGCGIHSWISGKRYGIQATLEHLEAEGYIVFDEE